MFKTKETPNSIKDIDVKQGIVVRYASSFDTVDSYNERTVKGCFKDTIKHWGPHGKNRIKSLWQHNPSMLVAKPIELLEDDYGLLVTDKFSSTPLAQDVLTLISEGIITESSIGFSVKKGQMAQDDVYELLEVQLYENSYVTWGANPDTPIVGIKNEQLLASIEAQDDVFMQMKSMEKALRNGTFETDDIPTMLELALAMWESKLKALTEKEEPTEEKIVITTDSSSEKSAQADDSEAQAESLTDEQTNLNSLLAEMQLFKLQQEANDFISKNIRS